MYRAGPLLRTLVLTSSGADKHAEELLAAPPRCTGQTGVAGKIRQETNERRPGRIPSGRRKQGCPRLGRPARTSSYIAEMKEEQHDRGWKSKGTRKKR
jgi:hypothetical protein